MITLGPRGSLRQQLIQGAFGSLAMKIGNTTLTLIMAVVLARVLGVRDFGIYVFCLSIVQILTVPSTLGGQQLLVREISAYQARGDFSLLRGLLIRFRQAGLLVSVLLALAAAGIGIVVYDESSTLIPFLLALALVPLLTFLMLQGSAMRGFRRIILGQIYIILRPALVIVLVGMVFWHKGNNPGADGAMLAQIAACMVLVILSFFLLRRILPDEAKSANPSYETDRWIKSVWPFVFAGAMEVLNKETSVVLLGLLRGPEDVGIFRVAQRGALLIPFGLHAVNMAIMPTLAELAAKGEKDRLQSLISKSVLAVAAFALPVGAGLIFGGKWLIPFVFGQEFAAAYVPLVILCLGQLFNAGMGSVGVIMNMLGFERLNAVGVAMAAVVSMIANLAFIPFLGVTGAAVATSISLALWNILLFWWLYRKTGLVCSIRLSGRG